MASTVIVLPGDPLPQETLPVPMSKKKTLTLGPGLRHVLPATIIATIAGGLNTDNKKNAAWIESNSGRYLPSIGDLVIATVNSSAAENFNCLLSPHTPYALLPHLAFEGATKKTRPQLSPSSLVYAKIVSAGRDASPELTCVDPSTGKADGLGPLKGGMIFKVSLSMARRLLLSPAKGGVTILDHLGKKIGFEVMVGRNGLVFVDGGDVKTTLAVGRAIEEADEEALGEKGQRKLAEKILKNT